VKKNRAGHRPRPIILVSPEIQSRGKEFGDLSISLSANYHRAVLDSGVLPLTIPVTTSEEVIQEMVARAQGVLLTGGDDLEPQLYTKSLPRKVADTVTVTPDRGARSFRELLLIQEAFRQRKPLLAICRGHQLLNVALGGTLIADLPSQKPTDLDHRRLNLRNQPVHEVRLTPGSLLSKITGAQKLSVNSTHHQAVGTVATPLRVSARSPDGIVEALELKPGRAPVPFLLSVQFHPERLADRFPEHAAIFRAFTAACAISRDHHL